MKRIGFVLVLLVAACGSSLPGTVPAGTPGSVTLTVHQGCYQKHLNLSHLCCPTQTNGSGIVEVTFVPRAVKNTPPFPCE